MTPSTRRYRAARHLVLPLNLLAGPGAVHARLEPGSVVTLDGKRAAAHGRFLALAERAGDLVALDDDAAAEVGHIPPAPPAAAPSTPSSPAAPVTKG